MEKLLKSIGANIKKQRKAKNLSQEDLAGLTEMDRSYLSELENGLKNPSIITLYKIAEALEIKVEDLLV